MKIFNFLVILLVSLNLGCAFTPESEKASIRNVEAKPVLTLDSVKREIRISWGLEKDPVYRATYSKWLKKGGGDKEPAPPRYFVPDHVARDIQAAAAARMGEAVGGLYSAADYRALAQTTSAIRNAEVVGKWGDAVVSPFSCLVRSLASAYAEASWPSVERYRARKAQYRRTDFYYRGGPISSTVVSARGGSSHSSSSGGGGGSASSSSNSTSTAQGGAGGSGGQGGGGGSSSITPCPNGQSPCPSGPGDNEIGGNFGD